MRIKIVNHSTCPVVKTQSSWLLQSYFFPHHTSQPLLARSALLFLLTSSASTTSPQVSPPTFPPAAPCSLPSHSILLCCLPMVDASTVSATSVQDRPSLLPCLRGGTAGWSKPWHFLGIDSSESHSVKLFHSREQEGFAKRLQKSENTKIYSRCHLRRGRGPCNASGIITSFLLSSHSYMIAWMRMKSMPASVSG